MRGTNVRNASYQRCEHPGLKVKNTRGQEGGRRGSGGGREHLVQLRVRAVVHRLGHAVDDKPAQGDVRVLLFQVPFAQRDVLEAGRGGN
eukprot:8546174-Pyramimonas_sp.AAC.1